MGARISAQDAAERGLITKAEADVIDGATRGRKLDKLVSPHPIPKPASVARKAAGGY